MGGIISTIRDLKVILKDLKITLKFTAKIVLKVHGIVDDMEHTMQDLKNTVNGFSSRLPKSPSHCDDVDPLSIAYINDVVNSIEHKAESVKASLANAVTSLTKDDLMGNTCHAWEALVSNKRLSSVMTKWASVPDGLGDVVKHDCEKLKELIHNVEERIPNDAMEPSIVLLEPDEPLDNKNTEKRLGKDSASENDKAYTDEDNQSFAEFAYHTRTKENKEPSTKFEASENSCVKKLSKTHETISSEDIDKVMQFLICKQSIFTGKKLDLQEIIIEEVLHHKLNIEHVISLIQPLHPENKSHAAQWLNSIVKLLQKNQQHRRPAHCDKIDCTLVEQIENIPLPIVDIQQGFLSLLLISLLQGIVESGTSLDECNITDLIATSSQSHNEFTSEVLHIVNSSNLY